VPENVASDVVARPAALPDAGEMQVGRPGMARPHRADCRPDAWKFLIDDDKKRAEQIKNIVSFGCRRNTACERIGWQLISDLILRLRCFAAALRMRGICRLSSTLYPTHPSS
jgi:hypothetical protein